MAATNRSKGSHGGISCFLIDKDTPGVQLGAQYQTMVSDQPWEIIFEDARVPVHNPAGEDGEGFKLGQKWLGVDRVQNCAHALGVAQRSINLAKAYAGQRFTFGKPLAKRQSSQLMLTDIYVQLEAARLLDYKAVSLIEQGGTYGKKLLHVSISSTKWGSRPPMTACI